MHLWFDIISSEHCIDFEILHKELERSKSLWHLSCAQPDIFQGRGGFAILGHFDKKFVKNPKKGPTGKILEFFLQDTLKTNIFDGIFNPKMETIKGFFPKNQGTFFDFQKRQERTPHLPFVASPLSCVPVHFYWNYTHKSFKFLNSELKALIFNFFEFCNLINYCWSTI